MSLYITGSDRQNLESAANFPRGGFVRSQCAGCGFAYGAIAPSELMVIAHPAGKHSAPGQLASSLFETVGGLGFRLIWLVLRLLSNPALESGPESLSIFIVQHGWQGRSNREWPTAICQ